MKEEIIMRIVKDADERKNEILDVAAELFATKGYDAATISDIIEKVGVARGTMYYHFKSKESVMDALIERTSRELLNNAKAIAEDKSIPVLDRLLQTILSMSLENDAPIIEHMHKPQNALMHQKTHLAMLEGIPPILVGIVEDGIREGIFNTPFPYETVEMIVAHTISVFDDYAEHLPPEQLMRRVQAFVFNLERLFGARPNSFNAILNMLEDKGAAGEEE